MENEAQNNDSSPDRRSFFRKLVAVAAATGLSSLLLSKLSRPVSANNIVPGSGQATFDGPVGIATTAPETLLHVSGPANADVFCGLGPHPNRLINGQYMLGTRSVRVQASSTYDQTLTRSHQTRPYDS
jgi:hypothetical protein